MQKIDIYLEEEIFDGLDGKLEKLDAKQRQRLIEQRTDRVAMMLAMYPTVNTRKLSRMFHIRYDELVKIAREAGVKKVERRGGHNRKKVEVVNLDGYVVDVYESIHEASVMSGIKEHSLQNKVSRGGGRFMEGTIIRYKKG